MPVTAKMTDSYKPSFTTVAYWVVINRKHIQLIFVNLYGSCFLTCLNSIFPTTTKYVIPKDVFSGYIARLTAEG